MENNYELRKEWDLGLNSKMSNVRNSHQNRAEIDELHDLTCISQLCKHWFQIFPETSSVVYGNTVPDKIRSWCETKSSVHTMMQRAPA